MRTERTCCNTRRVELRARARAAPLFVIQQRSPQHRLMNSITRHYANVSSCHVAAIQDADTGDPQLQDGAMSLFALPIKEHDGRRTMRSLVDALEILREPDDLADGK